MPIVTTEEHQGFTKRISRNDIAPKDGSAPLTVIEFSLTNEIRNSLKAALDAFRVGSRDEKKLAQIIKDHFPPEVLEELGALAKRGGAQSTVYVVKNLPESQVPNKLAYPDQKFGKTLGQIRDKLKKWREDHSYTYLVGHGVGAALELQHGRDFDLLRFVGNKEIIGDDFHKHAELVTMLGCVLTNNAATRFTDMQTLLEDESEKGPIKMRFSHDNIPDGRKVHLHDLPNETPHWKSRNEMTLTPRWSLLGKHKAAFERLVRRHSQEVVGQRGDLILWSEVGDVFHQAMPTDDRGKTKGVLSRHAVSQSFYQR